MVSATLKCAAAIIYGVRVFISYKMSQRTQADILRDIIKTRGFAGILNDGEFPFLAARTLKPGQKYRNAILSALDATHWFIFLLPDTSLDRTWTTFEAGYFRKAMLPGDRLICIHHPEVAKSGPLEEFNAVEASPKNSLGLSRKAAGAA